MCVRAFCLKLLAIECSVKQMVTHAFCYPFNICTFLPNHSSLLSVSLSLKRKNQTKPNISIVDIEMNEHFMVECLLNGFPYWIVFWKTIHISSFWSTIHNPHACFLSLLLQISIVSRCSSEKCGNGSQMIASTHTATATAKQRQTKSTVKNIVWVRVFCCFCMIRKRNV